MMTKIVNKILGKKNKKAISLLRQPLNMNIRE